MLVGRPTTSLSDKPKVPPPVPPRGTPKGQRQTINGNKGADLFYTNGNLLHDLLCLSVKSDSLSNFVTSLDDSDNLNFNFNQTFISKSENFLERNNQNVNSEKLKRYKKEPNISISPVQRSISMIVPSDSDDSSLKRRRSLPKSYKTKFSKLHDIDYITKSNPIKRSYGVNVKTLTNIYDKKSSPGPKPKVKRANFVMSSYLDEQKRYENIPRVFVSATSETESLPPSLSPRRDYNEIFNSKRIPRITKLFEKNSDLGDLV